MIPAPVAHAATSPAVLSLEGCVVDLPQQRVLRAEASLPLTTKEAEVLGYLAARPHVTVSRDELLRQVWGYARPPVTRATDLVVSRLRRKIELDPDAPRHIFTVTGAGYRFEPLADAPRIAAPSAAPGPVVLWSMDGRGLAVTLRLAEQLAAQAVPFVVDQASVADARPGPALEGASVLIWVLPAGPLPQLVQELLRLTEARRARDGLPLILPLVGPDAPPLTELGPTCPGPLAWEVDPGWCAAWVATLRAHPRPPWPLPPPTPVATQQSAASHVALQHNRRVPQPAGAGYNPDWYVPWPDLEREALGLLSTSGAPVVIQAAAGGGKTWLLRHLLDRRGGAATALLEPRALGGGIARSSDQLLAWLAQDLVDQLDLDVDLPDLSAAGPLGARRALDRWMERVVLPAVPDTLWLAWDGADQLRLNPGDDGVFQMLRAWASRARLPWDRLRLLLTISTEPALLMDRPELSPFNLTPPLRLGDLGPPSVSALVTRHGLADPVGTAQALAAWVGGHPYLVRLALYAMAVQGLGLDEIGDAALQGLGPWGDPLRALLLRLRANPPLGQAVAALARDPAAPLDLESAHRLVRVGLLRPDGAGFALRCPLYRRFLALHL